ncbi:tetratricopeptide repeat protein [Streptomyces sp. NPDC056121]|uniref:tetratricopeptide repeat protein n=1 Tax=Streptomyces sp. NPDC056121 TaxID=3345718 RepID=UPI0035D953E2
MTSSDRQAKIRQDASANDDARVYQAGRDIIVNEASTPQQSRLREQSPGRAISEIADPYAWEVHRAITVQSPGSEQPLPALPVYVEREHDHRLRCVVQQGVEGASKLVVLVGGSSTGKTRACWEAIQRLPPTWRLWHPLEPSRPEAALASFDAVESHTVLWLNELQHYLFTPNSALGETLAARLRALLRTPERGPVLVLGTLWHEYWARLTAPSTTDAKDLHSQARALLTGRDLHVPETFNESEAEGLSRATAVDPRLAYAVEHAEQRHVTQYLAGAPALVERYCNAPIAARAVIEVAMDAARLGIGPIVPLSLLEAAAPAYLTDLQWGQAADDWLSQALEYATIPLRGACGPLTRIRARPGEPELHEPHFRLADYLDQHGRSERICKVPPKAFWDAAIHCIRDPAALMTLAESAHDRWRYRHAVQLVRGAIRAGDDRALIELIALENRFDGKINQDLIRRASESTDPYTLGKLASWLKRNGQRAQAEELYERAANAGEIPALMHLAYLKKEAGDKETAARHYQRAVDLGDIRAIGELAELRANGDDKDGAKRLLEDSYSAALDPRDRRAYLTVLFEATSNAHLRRTALSLLDKAAESGECQAIVKLAQIERKAKRYREAVTLYRMAAKIGSQEAMISLAELAKNQDEEADWYRQAAAKGNGGALWNLAWISESRGDTRQAIQFMRQAAERGEPDAYWGLSDLFETNGETKEAELVALSDPDGQGLIELLYGRVEGGDAVGIDRLMRKAVDAGYRGDFGIHVFVESHRSGEPYWKQARRYGLEADGRPSDPWRVGPLDHNA